MIVDAESAASVRRGQRLIRMVSELHRLGYQRLRIMPYEYPVAWRLVIGPVDGFSQSNGAYWEGEADGCAHYSSAQRAGYFGWPDAHSDNARQLAEKFIARFPAICDAGAGRDWPYSGWLSELVGVLESSQALPVAMAEFLTPPPNEMRSLILRAYGGDGGDREFALPPPGLADAPLMRDISPSSPPAYLASRGQDGGKDLRTFAAVASLVGVAMSVGAQIFFARDEDVGHELLDPAADALAGLDPDFLVDRQWCCSERMGKAVTTAFDLPPDFAEPGLRSILLFGLEHISLAVRDILALTQDNADWDGGTLPLLVELQSFAVSALMGTASVLYPGRTLSSFVRTPK